MSERFQDRYYPSPTEEIQEEFLVCHVALQNCFYNGEISMEKFQREIVPLMYVISDIAVINSGYGKYGREKNSNLFKAWYKNKLVNYPTEDMFNERVNFYAEFVRGRQPRYEWMFFEKPDWKENGILRCCVAFGDLLWNPNCINDYDNAPVLIRNITDAPEFVIGMKNLISVIAEFYYNLYKKYLAMKNDVKVNCCDYGVANSYSEYTVKKIVAQKMAEEAEKKREKISLIVIGCILALFLLFGIIVNNL